MDSGDDSSSDDSGIDAGHEVSSAITSTRAALPGFCSSNEDRMKNTVNGGEGVRASDAVALNCQEHRDSIWLNVDHFSDSHLEFKVGAAEDKSEAMRDIEDKSGSDGDKVGQPEDGPQEMDYSIDEAEDGPEDGDGIAHNVKDVITDPVMDEIEVDDGDAEGWWHLRASSNRS